MANAENHASQRHRPPSLATMPRSPPPKVGKLPHHIVNLRNAWKKPEHIDSMRDQWDCRKKRKTKSGRGSAVLFGFKKILKMKQNISCFIEMDADLSHSPSELKRNISYFYSNSLDLLIGSRYLYGSKIINWPLSRRILSKFSNKLAKILLGIPVNDYTNGYRFYSKPAVKTIISKCNKTGGGFIILSEIILVLWKMNFKISEIKSIFKNRVRGESSVNLSLIIQSFFGLLKLYTLKKSL